MGKRNYISRTQVIMKTFAAALFAAVASATTYSVAGTADGTAVTSSKVSVTLAVVSKKLTQKHMHNVVSKTLTAADNVVSVLCTTREANKFVCSYCEAYYVDASNYKAINSIKGSTKNTLDCDSTYTDGTDNTDAREKVVKDAMATAQHATSSKVGGTIASKLATAKLVTGALSTVATVGAAIAALSMSF